MIQFCLGHGGYHANYCSVRGLIDMNILFFSLHLHLLRTDWRTDGRTDRRTDKLSYRDARTHLKRTILFHFLIDRKGQYENLVSRIVSNTHAVYPALIFSIPMFKRTARQKKAKHQLIEMSQVSKTVSMCHEIFNLSKKGPHIWRTTK